MKQIEAVIFDMDGLMFSTEELWFKSVRILNRDYGYKVPMELIFLCAGLRDDKTNQKIQEYMGEDFDINEFRRLSKSIINEDISKNGIKIKPGLFELLDYLVKNDIKMAIASSSKLDAIKRTFATANISLEMFSNIVSGEMVVEPKPHPQVYKTSQELLGINPDNILVLEDSEVGVMSASAAGLKVIMIPDMKEPSIEVEKLAYKKLNNLNQVIDVIEGLNN